MHYLTLRKIQEILKMFGKLATVDEMNTREKLSGIIPIELLSPLFNKLYLININLTERNYLARQKDKIFVAIIQNLMESYKRLYCVKNSHCDLSI